MKGGRVLITRPMIAQERVPLFARCAGLLVLAIAACPAQIAAAAEDGGVFIVGSDSSLTGHLYKFSRDGAFMCETGTARLCNSIDARDRELLVADNSYGELVRFTADCALIGTCVTNTSAVLQGNVLCIGVDSSGNLYAAARGEASAPRTEARYAGCTLDRTFNHAGLVYPRGIDADAAGNVWILNSAKVGVGNKLFKFNSAGGFIAMYDIAATSVPSDLAIDETGQILYVADESGGADHIKAYSISGPPTFIASIPTPGLGGAIGIAYEPVSGHLFAAGWIPGPKAVEITTTGSLVRTYATPTLDFAAWDVVCLPPACATFAAADFNHDCEVDATDFTVFRACAGGPRVPYHPSALPSGCTLTPVGDTIAADFDADGDVDMDDFGAFQQSWTGLRCTVFVPADFNRDCAVDDRDLGVFTACATGFDIPYDPATLPQPEPGCTLTPDGDGHIAADFDRDGDVDQEDFAVLQLCYSGPGQHADPHCAD